MRTCTCSRRAVEGLDGVGRAAGTVHGGFPNNQCPKKLLGVVDVVASTSELDVFNRCLTTRRIRLHVVEFEETALGAAALTPDKRALTAVARPHRSPGRGRDVARSRCALAGMARRVGGCRFLPLQLLQQQTERAIEDFRRITIQHAMSQEILRPSQLLVRRAVDRQLNFVSLWCQRRDGRGRGPSRCRHARRCRFGCRG